MPAIVNQNGAERRIYLKLAEEEIEREIAQQEDDLKNQIILELYPYINELTGRRPIILPIFLEV